jgi:hypothetical protein
LEQSTTIGKSPMNKIVLSDIKVRACTIEYSLDMWMLKPEDKADLYVYLANHDQLYQNRPSNVQTIQKDYMICTKDLSLKFDYLLKP